MRWNRNIKRILLFILIFVGLNEGIKVYFFKVSVHNHRLVKQDRAFNAYHGPLDYIVMGHSRPARDIDAQLIPGCYSYCSSSENNIRSYYKLLDVLKKHEKRIGVVLLPIGISSISLDYPDKMKNSFYWSPYMDYFELGELTGDRVTYLKMHLKTGLFPYYEYPYVRLMEKYKDMRVVIPNSVYASATEEERVSFAHDIITNQQKFAHINDTIAMQYVQKTINLTKSYGKPLVFIKYPVTNYYLDAVSTYEPRWIKEQQQIEQLVSGQENIYLLDFQNLFQDHPEYFIDTHHLNELGRTAFTKVLAEKLKSLK